jgi:hypothetical protein
VLLFFSWETGDLVPPGIDQNSLTVTNIAHAIPGELGFNQQSVQSNKPAH